MRNRSGCRAPARRGQSPLVKAERLLDVGVRNRSNAGSMQSPFVHVLDRFDDSRAGLFKERLEGGIGKWLRHACCERSPRSAAAAEERALWQARDVAICENAERFELVLDVGDGHPGDVDVSRPGRLNRHRRAAGDETDRELLRRFPSAWRRIVTNPASSRPSQFPSVLSVNPARLRHPPGCQSVNHRSRFRKMRAKTR